MVNPSGITPPRRLVLIRPCCIGDVVLATATLRAFRRAYPETHITWAVSSWAQRAIAHHPDIDAFLDTGSAALPVKSVGGFIRFVRQLRAGRFDMAVSLVRSPLMSAAVRLSGIPVRVGLDSAGRGFGYNIRAPIDPKQPRHEAHIYLDTARVLDIDTTDCYVNIPVLDDDRQAVRETLQAKGITGDYLVIHPGGGSNPGMVMDSKRWPPANYAALAQALTGQLNVQVILLAGPDDNAIIDAVQAHLDTPIPALIGEMDVGEVGALALESRLYIGNDTGLTHLAAAAGAKTVMILGPSDPARYAPFAPDSLALWKPVTLEGGVSEGVRRVWDWSRDGIGIDEVVEQVLKFYRS